MKNVIITGSSGMIGGLVLNKCLSRNDVGKITLINRHPSGIKNSKVNEVIHKDLLDYSSIENVFEGHDICFFCIGVYTGAVPPDEFRKITVDYTLAFAEVLKKHSPNAAFCFLSGAGADLTGKSRIMFARDKGVAERGLLDLNFGRTHIFRPGYIYPVTPRKEPNLLYVISRLVYKPIKIVYPNIGTTSEKLSDVMVEVGLEGGDKQIYENRDIRLY